jgi:chemotaxis signal transduction protein
MSALGKAGENSFVLLQIGNRRVALPAEIVAELAPPVRLHTFPHTSQGVTGVIVRRGRIVPVYDAGSVLAAKNSSAQRFYLIARRQLGKPSEWGAIPVNGECELVTSPMQLRSPEQPAYVAGTLDLGNESLDVLDFEAFVASNASRDHDLLRAEAQS